MSLRNIAVIGANGNLGPFVLNALQSDSNFNITVLSRQSSKSTYHSSITVINVPDDMPYTALVSALSGQDALVMTFAGTLNDLSHKVIDAAYEAGVKRVIPADFGSCDSADPRTLRTIRYYPDKKRVRDHLVDLVAKSQDKDFSWTSIICAHFLDFGLQTVLLGFNIPKRTARVFDGGNVRFSASMLRTVGLAVARVLAHADETRDKIVYVHSVSTTQNELLRAVETVVGGNKFEIEHRNSDEYLSMLQQKLKVDPDNHDAMEDLIGVEGMVNADWRTRDTFMNDLLGLPDEDLESMVRESLARGK